MTAPSIISSGLLHVVAVVVLCLCLLLAAVVVFSKLLIARRQAATRARLAPLRPDLLEVAAGEDADGAARARLIAHQDHRGELDRALVSVLSKVRGAPAEALVEVLRGRDAVGRTVRATRSMSSVHRARAFRTLGLLRDADLVPDLLRGLHDRSPEVRLVAARAIGAVGPPAGERAARAVLRAVRTQHAQPGVAAGTATEALVRLGVVSQPAVREGITDDDSGVRLVAATVAGRGLFSACAAQLAGLARSDPDQLVRIAATQALGELGRPADGPVLTALTGAVEPVAVRRAAATALGRLGTEDAAVTLAGLLGDADRGLAGVAATALGESAPGQAALDRVAADPAGSAPAVRAARATLEVLRLRSGKVDR
ncbi:HEAT repeat domain-containing protein [Flexivirga lutea]